jgi:hypothetical protein
MCVSVVVGALLICLDGLRLALVRAIHVSPQWLCKLPNRLNKGKSQEPSPIDGKSHTDQEPDSLTSEHISLRKFASARARRQGPLVLDRREKRQHIIEVFA